MRTRGPMNQADNTPANNLDELNDKLNRMIKEIMGRRSATTIAKKCGVSVSTITRIRNGENKRGISEELLHKIWKSREPDCNIDLSQLMSLNSDVIDAHAEKENARWKQEQEEIEFLEKQIQKSMFNSGVFLRKVTNHYEIIPDIELYSDMSYEVAFESGEKRRILFFTQFYSKRRIEQMEERKKENPEYSRGYCRHYRTIMDFRELRALHQEYENAELVIVFNYEDSFRYNVDTLKKLSNKENIALALMDFRFGNILEEVCLDGRKKGILKELKLV